jgi:hypothetical protein
VKSVSDREVRRLTLGEVGPREFDVVAAGVCYRHVVPGVGLTFTFDRLRWKSEELHCELTVTSSLEGANQVNGDVISQASFNVSSDRARSDRAQRIAKEAQIADVPIGRLLEEACQRVLAAERGSASSISLHDVEDEADASQFSCDGIVFNPQQISMFYGLPGSGKTLEADRLALEMVRSGRRVGYCDFEWEPGPHRKRAKLMYGAQFPDVRYLRLGRPLIQEIDGLRRTVINEGWDFAVLDSVSFGVSGPPESAEVASEFLQACRQLRIGLLLVAHQTKGEGGDKFPFGSIMWFAGARDIYHFRRSNSEEATDALPIRQRLRHALRAGPRSIEDLATEIDVKSNSIIQALKRDEDGHKRGKARHFLRMDSKVALYEDRIA